MALETEFKPGDFVRYGEPNGSTGKIVEETHYSPIDSGRTRVYYVRWVYGLDKAGQPMTQLDSIKAWQCIRITEEEYNKVANRQGWVCISNGS